MNNMLKQRKCFDLERGELLPFLLLLPTVLIVLIVMIVPLIYGFIMSLFNYDLGAKVTASDFIGLGNYVQMLGDATVWKSLVNTITFAVCATVGDLVIGTIIAVLLLAIRPRIARFLRGVFTMPLLISPIIVGLIWRYMYDPYSGFIYWVLGLFGVGVHQFPGITAQSTALLCVIIAHWWQVTPFVLIVVTAGLVSIPMDLYEAARIDGASETRTFFSISLPLLTKVYMVILIISGVDTLKVFDIVYSLTQGGPANSTMSISIYAYKNAFEMTRMGYAMSISLLAMLVSFIMFGIPFIKFNSIKKRGR